MNLILALCLFTGGIALDFGHTTFRPQNGFSYASEAEDSIPCYTSSLLVHAYVDTWWACSFNCAAAFQELE
jgi:hypothetical protein